MHKGGVGTGNRKQREQERIAVEIPLRLCSRVPDAVDDLDAEAHKQGSEQNPAPELLFPVNLFIKEEEHTAEQNQHAAVDLRIAVKDLRRVIAERKELADHLRRPEVRLRVRDTVARGVFTASKQ